MSKTHGMDMRPFTTKDFNEAALLLASKVPLIKVERDYGVCHFSFGHSSRAIGLTESFWRGDAIGNIREFVDAQRRVKDLIHKNGNEHETNSRI